MSHLYLAIPVAKSRTIHLDSHVYRGVLIEPYGLGFEGRFDGHYVFATTWIAVEKLINGIKDKK